MPGTGMFDPIGAKVEVALHDNSSSHNAMLCKCKAADIPSAVAGYGIGCILIATDTGAVYANTGTAASCSFVVLSATMTAGTVVLAMLAAGITPSHVVKYAGKITWSGSGASLATTVTGVASTDIVVATIQTAPTQAAYIKSAAPTTDTVTLTLSAANTSNDAVISYTVFRAAA